MKRLLLPALMLAGLISSLPVCAASQSSNPADFKRLPDLEAELVKRLAAVRTDTDFTLMLKSANGHVFHYSRGESGADVSYESASTSKMVAAAVILRLVEQGKLSLDSHPQAVIPQWPTTGNLGAIELRQLLDYTSGLKKNPPCSNIGKLDFETCALRTLSYNNPSPEPGRQFYYDSSHLQIAGLMAVKAAGAASWQQVFNDFRQNTGLFKTATYDLPSANNPRLAGGMHWNATEYLEFLDALYHGKVIGKPLLDEMTRPQTLKATTIYSPAEARIQKSWPYGLGVWIECEPQKGGCTGPQKVSSPGAYGAYPFMDFRHEYVGILARQGGVKTFNKGYELLSSQEAWLQRWAELAKTGS